MKGQPVFFAIPQADVANMRAISGDPTVTSRVVRASSEDIGKLCALLIRSLEPAERRSAIQVMSANASGERLPSVPMPALLPDGATIEQLADAWNGLMMMLLALGTASADTSVGSVVANAAAMASGAPFASDPMVGERQNEVMLAKAILEAALLGDDQAKAWFKDNDLSEALKNVAKGSGVGKTDMVPYVTSTIDRLKEMYDCHLHGRPLGGDAAASASTSLADFWNDIWNSTKGAIGQGIQDVANVAAAGITGTQPKTTSGVVSSNGAASVLPTETADLNKALTEGVSNAAQAVAEAKRAMEDGNANLNEYRARLRDASLQQAKLQWAEAILSAPEEVATILAAANPNMNDAGSFIQSMLATLPAAKTTGNLGTIKALIYALKAAASRGDGSAESLYSLLSGSPDRLVEKLEELIIDANSAALNALLSRQQGDRVAAGQSQGTSGSVKKGTVSQTLENFADIVRKEAGSSLERNPAFDKQLNPPSSEPSPSKKDADIAAREAAKQKLIVKNAGPTVGQKK